MNKKQRGEARLQRLRTASEQLYVGMPVDELISIMGKPSRKTNFGDALRTVLSNPFAITAGGDVDGYAASQSGSEVWTYVAGGSFLQIDVGAGVVTDILPWRESS